MKENTPIAAFCCAICHQVLPSKERNPVSMMAICIKCWDKGKKPHKRN